MQSGNREQPANHSSSINILLFLLMRAISLFTFAKCSLLKLLESRAKGSTARRQRILQVGFDPTHVNDPGDAQFDKFGNYPILGSNLKPWLWSVTEKKRL